MKKIQPSKHVIGFCTAVIFEVLGLVTVDSDMVKRILPYVSSGLQLGAKGLNQKVKFQNNILCFSFIQPVEILHSQRRTSSLLNMQAAALMIVSLLAQKAALAPNVVKSLLHSVADMSRADAKGGDLRWLRMSVMTIISIVQVYPVVTFNWKIKLVENIIITLFMHIRTGFCFFPLWRD